MTEILFVVEEDLEGGFSARAVELSIFTPVDDLDSLKQMVCDAARCHIPDEKLRPKLIRLH